MASVTITTTAPQDTRIAPAFGRRLGLQSSPGVFRDATGAEVKAALIAYMVQVVKEEEQAAARRAADAAVTVITPT